MKVPVIAIFDIGKTNKKLLLFDERYRLVFERSERFVEVTDEDGDACEDLNLLHAFVVNSLGEVGSMQQFELKFVNFAAYGASLVYLDEDGSPLTPLYNYLKPYPPALKRAFYGKYGGEARFSAVTASPVLGSLNSGMQLYRLKEERPTLFKRVSYALHLPQYLSYVLSRQFYSDVTSIGCHTGLWDFTTNAYHEWVDQEGISEKLAPIMPVDTVFPFSLPGITSRVGIGLHDSSAALIPYLASFQEPFVLVSTGTWCISLNAFDAEPLTEEQLKQDCLNYRSYHGQPVKASRLFTGNEHEKQVGRIAKFFNEPVEKFNRIPYDSQLVSKLRDRTQHGQEVPEDTFIFQYRALAGFVSSAEAYHQLLMDLVELQKKSIKLIINSENISHIFVDGGFSRNDIFMHLLAKAFPEMEVYGASMAEATALGAALAVHGQWNSRPLPDNLIQLKAYPVEHSEKYDVD